MPNLQDRIPFKASPGIQNALKAGLILGLVLVLCIPLEMIKSVAREREGRRDEARMDIMEKAGGSAILGAVSVVVPVAYLERMTDSDGEETVKWRERKVWFLPDELDIKGKCDTELRKRGIYSVPVFSGEFTIATSFALHPALTGLESARPAWEKAALVMEFRDSRSLRNAPILVQGKERRTMSPCQDEAILNARALSAPIALVPRDGSATVCGKAEIELDMSGAMSLNFLSLGAKTSVSLSGDWPSPSFSGFRLPASRELGPEGFSAAWFAEESSRPLPKALFRDDSNAMKANETSFGLEFYLPTDVYLKTHRALRYGAIFLIIPFAGLFLLEALLKFKVHPLQYVLIGAADILFYLLLLSVSEHLAFGWAYLAASGAVTALIGAYAWGAFRSERRAFLIAPIIAAQYGYLFFALESEDYALLIGAIGLFAILAIVMLLTRGFDWYEARLVRGKGAKGGPGGGTPGTGGENAPEKA